MKMGYRFLIIVIFGISLSAMEPEKEQVIKYEGIGVAHEQGRRPTMEDKDSIAMPFAENHNDALLALYDGHGGAKVAEYVCKELHANFEKALAIERDPKVAFIKAFEQTDANLKKSDLEDEAKSQGTTAIVTFKQGNKIYAANVGDSRAILSRGGQAIALSEDHKPDRPDEKKRIEDAGGVVKQYCNRGPMRVNGILAVSRAIGDHKLAPFVIPTPDIKEITITGQDEFLLLACDGIFDVMDNQEAVNIVINSLQHYKDDPKLAQKAAGDLVQKAYDKGSGDNLSVIVAILKQPAQWSKRLIKPASQLTLPAKDLQMLLEELDSIIQALPITVDRFSFKFDAKKVAFASWQDDSSLSANRCRIST